MKTLNHILGLLLALAAAGAGIILLQQPGNVGAGGETSPGTSMALSPLTLAWYGASLLLLAVLYLLTGVARRRRRLIAFDNEGGTVSISADAIGDFLARLAPEFPAVLRLAPDVEVARNRVVVRVAVRVRAGQPIHELCELLQQRIRESLVTGLGITQVGRVEVKVTDLITESKSA